MDLLTAARQATKRQNVDVLRRERRKLKDLIHLVQLRKINTEHGEEIQIHNLRRDGTRRNADSRENNETEGLFHGLSVEYDAVGQNMSWKSVSDEKPSEEEHVLNEEKAKNCVEEVRKQSAQASFPQLAESKLVIGAPENTMMDWINEYTKEKVYVRPLVVYPSQRVNLAHNYEDKSLFDFSRYQGANTTVGHKLAWEQMMEAKRTHRTWTESMHMKYAIATPHQNNENLKLIHALFEQQGFQLTSSNNWHCMWTCQRMKARQFRSLNSVQRVNQFPETENVHDRVLWARFAANLHETYQNEFNEVPAQFVLPEERDNMRTYRENHPESWYFVEYLDMSHNRIKAPVILQAGESFAKTKQLAIVSSFIRTPLLLLQRQVEIRVFSNITCFDPLRVYIYKEGVVYLRIPYDWPENEMTAGWGSDGQRKKKTWGIDEDHDFDPVEDSRGRVHRSWTWLQAMLHQQGFDEAMLWRRLRDVVLKTTIALQSKVKIKLQQNVKYRRNCFELMEFKFLIDRRLKPWLLKVRQPDLSCISAVELSTVSGAVADTLNMACIGPQHPIEPRRRTRTKRWKKNRNERLRRKKNKKTLTAQEHIDMATPSEMYNARIRLVDELLNRTEKAIFAEISSEYCRRGEFVRIYPCADWRSYEDFFVDDCVLRKFVLEQVLGSLDVKADRIQRRNDAVQRPEALPKALRPISEEDSVLFNLQTGRWNSLKMRPTWLVYKAADDIRCHLKSRESSRPH